MAKSKTGGSRAYIRGRIGSDVYSIGKDGKGKKQQVVRSLAESVANPQTAAQMTGRMIMSTISQAVAALRPIIDHSFDNVSGRQPNISEFTRLNYALIKADVEAHPSSGNAFGLNKYQEKGAKTGKYQISKGDIVLPSAISKVAQNTNMAITLPQDAVTVGSLKTALGGLSSDGYITMVTINNVDHTAKYIRLKLDTALADTTTITSSNVGNLFSYEGNDVPVFSLNNEVINVSFSNNVTNTSIGVIASDKVQGQWKHSDEQMNISSVQAPDWTASVALPTYPQGENFYLNGGDL